MTPVVVFGGGIGVGLVVVARGMRPSAPSLAASMRRLDRPGVPVRQRGDDAAGLGSASRLGTRLARTCSGHLGARVDADLAAMQHSPERFALQKLATALALAAIAVALGVVLALVGAALNGALSFVLVVVGTAVGFVTPDIVLRANAATRRTAFRHALSSYLDLVNVLLAGGAGLETALVSAAQAGDGWSFTQIRTTLVRARTMRRSPFEAFTELGDVIGIGELREIAASVRLAGEQGARIKLSLASRASALRASQMARIEADANAATERLGLPTVLMFLGFIVLLGYPALQQVVGAL